MIKNKEHKYTHLSQQERFQLEAFLKVGISVKEIAKLMGRNKSTIYREKNRGKSTHRNYEYIEETIYVPELAQAKYEEHLRNKGRDLKIGNDIKYANFLEDTILQGKFSPEAALMKAEKEDFDTRICTTTLYSYIRKGVFLSLNLQNLPYRRKKKKAKVEKVQKRRAAGTSIEKRPKDILKREKFGDWEMDSVVGAQGKAKQPFLVLTERKTRFEIVQLLKNYSSGEVVKALNHIEKAIGTENFRKIFKSITVDNGREFADAKGMETCRRSNQKRTSVYYCHPYSSSERGSNENNNKLIRRHHPKGTVFDGLSKTEVREIQDWINVYPRKLFKGSNAAEMFTKEMEMIDFGKYTEIIYNFFLPIARASPLIE